ncbi:MAG TPA: VCBS repeat-containing protein [Thermoanaerobaculia bacterium]|nr:VCBS repeat-containing protein [Thermoanaerobaculia bacterium]
MKTNPDVVEETSSYYVQRYKKSDMVKVDETHVRLPYMKATMPLVREDADYYYIRVEKVSAEEMKAAAADRRKEAAAAQAARRADLERQAKGNPLVVTPEQFESLDPGRAAAGVRFERAGEGLPRKGQWRQNIAVADIDGDGKLDIVATPARLGGGGLFKVWSGDGKGSFHETKVTVVNKEGKPASPSIQYGGVAVADLDGDGRPDVVTASHGGTVLVFLNRGGGNFQMANAGLPPKLSSQAVAIFDVNGDGRPDLVVSQDMINNDLRRKTGKDTNQVRVFLNGGKAGWKKDPGAPVGACFSFDIFPIDLAGTGTARDLLTGCRALGGWGLTWKNDGKGKFENELFETIEQAAYHFAVAPGTVGPEHHPAFVDLFEKHAGALAAQGLNVYFKDSAGWHTIPVWRQKSYRARLISVAMGDLDGDGLDDIVFPDRAAKKVRIFFQTPDGKFMEAPENTEPPLDCPATDTRLADIDGDGRLDIVLSKATFSESPMDPGGIDVFLNRGR